MMGKEDIKEIEDGKNKVNRNNLSKSIKVDQYDSDLTVLKYKLSNKLITVNELDNDTVKKLIEMYKKSNNELKSRILKDNG